MKRSGRLRWCRHVIRGEYGKESIRKLVMVRRLRGIQRIRWWDDADRDMRVGD